MKTILLHVQNDKGLENQFQVALSLARALDAHLSCIQITHWEPFLFGQQVAPEAFDMIMRGLEEPAREQREDCPIPLGSGPNNGIPIAPVL